MLDRPVSVNETDVVSLVHTSDRPVKLASVASLGHHHHHLWFPISSIESNLTLSRPMQSGFGPYRWSSSPQFSRCYGASSPCSRSLELDSIQFHSFQLYSIMFVFIAVLAKSASDASRPFRRSALRDGAHTHSLVDMAKLTWNPPHTHY